VPCREDHVVLGARQLARLGTQVQDCVEPTVTRPTKPRAADGRMLNSPSAKFSVNWRPPELPLRRSRCSIPTAKCSEAARRCIELIAKHNMILATGHIGRAEIFALVKAAREMGAQRVVVTHAEFPSQNLRPTSSTSSRKWARSSSTASRRCTRESFVDGVSRRFARPGLNAACSRQIWAKPSTSGCGRLCHVCAASAGWRIHRRSDRRMAVTNPSTLVQ